MQNTCFGDGSPKYWYSEYSLGKSKDFREMARHKWRFLKRLIRSFTVPLWRSGCLAGICTKLVTQCRGEKCSEKSTCHSIYYKYPTKTFCFVLTELKPRIFNRGKNKNCTEDFFFQKQNLHLPVLIMHSSTVERHIQIVQFYPFSTNERKQLDYGGFLHHFTLRTCH